MLYIKTEPALKRVWRDEALALLYPFLSNIL